MSAAPNRLASALNKLLLPALGGPSEHDLAGRVHGEPRRHLLGDAANLGGDCVQSRREFVGEMNSMSSSTKSRPASSSASSVSSSSRSRWSGRARLPASCSTAVCSSSCLLGVDHAEHGFGLREIEPAGQERAEREFARLGEPGAGAADGFENRTQQRRRAERVELGDRLARVAAIGRPEEEVAGQRAAAGPSSSGTSTSHRDDNGVRTISLAKIELCPLLSRRSSRATIASGRRAADADHAAGRAAGGRGDRRDGVVGS